MIGKFLKQQREFAQISQRDLSKKTGIKQANLSRWENDIQSPQIDAVITLAKFYDISLDELVGLSDNPAPTQQNNLPTKQIQAVVDFTNEYSDIISDKNFIQTAKLFKAAKPELRALALGYLVGLFQSNGINTKAILGF